MGFWGIEVKPGKPHPYHSDNVQGSLFVTQATLGLGEATERSILQCAAGHKDPVFLCSLLPGQSECCSLNLEFKDELVAFSVIGPRSIHLSGYFVSDEGDQLRDEYEYDSEEGIGDTESDYESSNYDEDHSDDSMEYANDDDDEMFPPAHKSGVVIEEIVDEDMTKDSNDLSKRKKRKKSENSKKDAEKQIVLKSSSRVPVLESEDEMESEDEDGFPISAQQTAKSAVPSAEKKVVSEDPAKKKLADGTQDVKGKKRKEQENQPEVKKKNKKNQKGKGKADKVDSGKTEDNAVDNSSPPEDANERASLDEGKSTSADKKQKKNKKKKTVQKEEGKNVNPASTHAGDGIKVSMLSEEIQSTAKPSQVRTSPNGLVIEELKIGVPDGKRASDGSKVGVHYIGRLKKNGKIFDSKVSGKPFEFRLGVGQVIKGWDVGVKGMRVGDKRKLTIPPSMGYGAKATGPIPPNAWLEFDVELVNVR